MCSCCFIKGNQSVEPIDKLSFLRSKWIRNNSNDRLHVVFFEPRSKNHKQRDVALFFIHGVAGCTEIWRSQMEYLAQLNYGVYALDLLGHGKSDRSNNAASYRFESLAKDVEQFFDTYKHQNNIVIGHSYGTAFALWLSKYREEFIQELVLISGGGPYPLAPMGTHCCPLEKIPNFLFCAGMPLMKHLYIKKAFSHKSKKIKEKDISFNTPGYVFKYIMIGQEWLGCTAEFHKQIKQPTLLLHGTEDEIEMLTDTRLTAQAIPNSQFQSIPAASHMCMMEHPLLISESIATFISQPMPRDDLKTSGSVLDVNENCSSADRIAEEQRDDTDTITKSLPNLRLFH